MTYATLINDDSKSESINDAPRNLNQLYNVCRKEKENTEKVRNLNLGDEVEYVFQLQYRQFSCLKKKVSVLNSKG